MFERSRKGEHALLIQPHAGGPPDEGLLEEFADLARTAKRQEEELVEPSGGRSVRHAHGAMAGPGTAGSSASDTSPA